MKRLVIIVILLVVFAVACVGCNSGVTDPPYQPKVGPLKGDGPWGYCTRGYASTGCGICHIIY